MLATFLGFYNTATSRTHVRFQFSTHAAAGGNVAPNSAFEAADLRIYRANDGAAFSATQRSSANGITMTSPFDSLTGFHDVDIDLTDNTDSGFYAAGYLYAVVLAPDETVDSQTITGVVLAYFEIGVQPANVTQYGGTAGTFSSGRPEVNTTHAAGTAWGSGAITAASIAADAITAAKIADGAIDAGAIASDAITAAKIADGAIDSGAFASGAITAAAIAADAIGASELAADAVAEIQSGLATSSALTTLSTRLTGLVMAQGTIGATGNSTTALHLSGLTYGNDEINNCLLVIFDVSESEYHARWVEDWADTGDLATVATLPFTPQNSTDTYWLLPVRRDITTLDAAGVRAAVGLASANLDTQIAAVQADTDDIQTRLPAALVGGRIDSNVGAVSGDATAADNLEAAADGTGYNLGGGSVVAASVTGNVGGNVTGSVGSVAAGGITASSIATGAIDADALAADAVDEILDEQIGDGTLTMRQALRVLVAGMAGKLSGAATTTVTIRNLADSADVVVATVDSNGNRTAVTVTP